MSKRLQIIIVFFLCSGFLFGQTSFKITNYNSKQGLSNSSVYDVIKDKAGFLWISTELGINKFDGTSFKKYTPNSHNLPDNTVTNSTVLNDSLLFFSSGTCGYFKFDVKNEKVISIPIRSPSFLHKSHNIKLHNNKVYILSIINNYISIYDLTKSQITDTICFDQKHIFDYDFDEKGVLVAATEKGLQAWHEKKTASYILEGSIVAKKQPIHSIAIKENKVYFSNGTTLFVYDYTKKRILDSVRYSPTDRRLGELFIDRAGNAWFCTQFRSELYYYDFAAKQLTNFDPFVTGNDNSITSIIQDDEDNIWIGSYNTGLYKIAMSVFKSVPSLLSSNVYKVAVLDSNNYLLAIKNGLNILNTKTGNLENIKFKPEDKDYIYDLKKINNRFVIVNQLHNNIKLTRGNISLFFLKARSICAINDTLVLLGGWSNTIQLARFKNDKVDTLKAISFDHLINKRSRINCFYTDKKGRIWCGCDHGLLFTSLKNPTVFGKINDTLLNTQILDITESKSGEIYIATNKGLYRYFNEKAELIKELNNHPIEKINSFCKDQNENIYVGTLSGLFKIRSNSSSEFFSIDDGLNSNEINKLIYNPYKNSVLVGTNEGLSELNLYLNKYVKKHIPRIHFDGITSTGEVTYVNGIYELEKRNVNIIFSSICYNRTNSITYKRIIDGGIERVIENSPIELAAMNYGRHNIKIYASNDGRSWSRPIEVNILIRTPFYFTLWFLILVGSLFCFGVWAFLKYRIRNIKDTEQKKNEMEQKMLSLKHEALNASINPHFIFNALNSVQHYINTNRNDEASDYLAKFGNLIRNALENASQQFISLDQEEQRLKTYVELEQLRFNNGFTFEFVIEGSIDKAKCLIPNMILQPLIENSIIHGFKQINYTGELSVKIREEKTGLTISIEDNGRGIHDNSTTFNRDKTKSIGMDNVKERLATIPGATIIMKNKADLDKKQTGIGILIFLPFNK